MTTTADSILTADSLLTADGGGAAGGRPFLPYEPDNALDLEMTPRVYLASFGDGYEQRARRGLNHKLQKWSVTYDLKQRVLAEAVYDFFDSLDGVETFQWVPPGESQARLFVARSYKKSLPYGDRFAQTITTTFEEVPA
jgi:phage-related protein